LAALRNGIGSNTYFAADRLELGERQPFVASDLTLGSLRPFFPLRPRKIAAISLSL